MRGKLPLVAAFDLLCCLLIILVLQQNPPKKPPHVPTFGQYAVLISWKDSSDNDVDLYVRDSRGRICYFGNQDIGLMHLEVDDLGTAASGSDGGVRVVHNGERTVIRGSEPGEYTVNVHMYNRADPGQTVVHVTLWSLQGDDRILYTRDVVLGGNGDEHTAFRFRLDSSGHVAGYNRVPTRLVDAALTAPGRSSPPPVSHDPFIPPGGTSGP